MADAMTFILYAHTGTGGHGMAEMIVFISSERDSHELDGFRLINVRWCHQSDHSLLVNTRCFDMCDRFIASRHTSLIDIKPFTSLQRIGMIHVCNSSNLCATKCHQRTKALEWWALTFRSCSHCGRTLQDTRKTQWHEFKVTNSHCLDPHILTIQPSSKYPSYFCHEFPQTFQTRYPSSRVLVLLLNRLTPWACLIYLLHCSQHTQRSPHKVLGGQDLRFRLCSADRR